MTFKKALFWTGFWVISALLFNIGVYYFSGGEKALQFLTGYIIELSLSMDNVFLFLMLFGIFNIQPKHQRKVLNYGIAGAVVMRLIFILLGVNIVHRFEWILYIFGGILIFTAFKIIFGKDDHVDPGKNKVVRVFKKFVPVTPELHGEKFIVKMNGVFYATPLFVVLLLIESTDLLFAVDSIPAIFAITTDPFIIYTSNIFAIIGLRSFYFFLVKVKEAFIYIKQGVGVILFITGSKMLLMMFHIKVPVPIALGLIVGVMAISVITSLFAKSRVLQTDS